MLLKKKDMKPVIEKNIAGVVIETGTIRYSCWMGMIHGDIKIVE